jgi:hypothetical protein
MAPNVGDTLTAALIDSNYMETLTFTWLGLGASGPAQVLAEGPSHSFTVTAAHIGMRISVRITSSVPAGTIESAQTTAVTSIETPDLTGEFTLTAFGSAVQLQAGNAMFDAATRTIHYRKVNQTFTRTFAAGENEIVSLLTALIEHNTGATARNQVTFDDAVVTVIRINGTNAGQVINLEQRALDNIAIIFDNGALDLPGTKTTFTLSGASLLNLVGGTPGVELNHAVTGLQVNITANGLITFNDVALRAADTVEFFAGTTVGGVFSPAFRIMVYIEAN